MYHLIVFHVHLLEKSYGFHNHAVCQTPLLWIISQKIQRNIGNSAAMEGKDENFEEERRGEVEEKEVIQDDCVDDGFEEEDSDEDCGSHRFIPSPLVPLRDHLVKDKEDDSLRRWKEKLLGDGYEEMMGQTEPEVTFYSIGIVSNDYEETVLPLPIESESPLLFTLNEGAKYRLKLKFRVQHNIVSGLTYMNTVWKGSRKINQAKGMLGTFAPSRNPYEELLEAESTPSGLFARGIYSAKLQFKDDDNHSYLDLNYSFEIKKH
ncbi:rho GDP-dissociation inhibitor 1-like isoform X2 [Asparagus officinalis]|uniref:rho GDP-dissociation inhibitor 1-like isoform X2 n=1 Tax=Asparagus officinalis TaxID=4686 RepID=UPI00098DFA57|nr:rho GDP-dissociation inhibitor 1-like isoform X2 [Asparagus officinalis]